MLARPLLARADGVARTWRGKASVFALTYAAYSLATAARLPYSITKASLRPDHPLPENPGWRPFTDEDGQVLLGSLDTIFMSGYALAMPLMGVIADRTNQPIFLSLALLLVGIVLILVGMAHAWQIHAYGYFAILAFLGGWAQSICYPCVMAVICRWYSKANIGLILGIWATSTPMGTIVGKLGCARVLAGGWQLVFAAAGVATMVGGALVAVLLVDDPRSVGLRRPGEAERLAIRWQPLSPKPADNKAVLGAGASLLGENATGEDATFFRTLSPIEDSPVPFGMILRIPGLVPYCCATFFSKLSYYAFLFWLPFYLSKSLGYSDTDAGEMSTWFDWGGFTGGILGGILIDRLRVRGAVLLMFQTSAVPLLCLYQWLGQDHQLSDASNACMLFALGFTVTTPYSLITSVVASDLASHESLRGNPRACATVTALLDGVGSCGAALQGLLIGWVSTACGWGAVFRMLMVLAAFSALCLVRPTWKELRARRHILRD